MVIIEKLMIKKQVRVKYVFINLDLKTNHTIEITILSGKFAIDRLKAAAKNSSEHTNE